MGLLTLKHSHLAYRLDFALYGGAVGALGIVLLVASPRSDMLVIATCSLAGLIAWSAIEYGFHRFILHGLEPFRRWHAAHHLHPTDLILSPTLFSASLIFALVFLPSLALAGLWRASALTFGVLTGYFFYAITHHATHHWRPRGAWLRRRKQWHAAHHHDSAYQRCFGVTTCFWDRLLGSAPPGLPLRCARVPGAEDTEGDLNGKH